MAPSSHRSTCPAHVIVEEVSQGLDLGQLGHRPMMPVEPGAPNVDSQRDGRAADGDGGDGTVAGWTSAADPAAPGVVPSWR